MIILNTIGPIVLIVGLGAILYRTKFLSAEVFQANSRLVYWIGLPCLLFYKTAQPASGLGTVAVLLLVLIAGMLACVGIALILMRALGLQGNSRGAYVQAAYRGNLAYVGLPVILFAFSQAPEEVQQTADTLTILALAPLVPIYNLAAVLALLGGRARPSGRAKRRYRELVTRTLTNPLIISCLAGLAWSATGIALPQIVSTTVKTVGSFSLPLALFAVGASLRLRGLRKNLPVTLSAALIKVAVGPLAGYLIGTWVGLSSVELRIAMIFLACPTAVAAYVMAEQMGSDEELTAKIIVLSVLLSLPALTVVMMVT